MPTCSNCGATLKDAARYCSSCGSELNANNFATLDFPGGGQPSPKYSSSKPVSSSVTAQAEGRFLPGAVLADRYRVVALLGRGGMGEVYRADDLTLGQPVALKFLPDDASDESVLERFRNEVRIARRVSHPNVCRVYDIGQVDGHSFFTMEFIDGEDLASLLRRIGRLPSDKGVQIAQQICAGLAAAHAKGVLHRDLKPANIMLDGRGQVVITDFGLAGIAGQIHGAEIRSGTPAYMSPEQLAGKEVNARSDIYSLGLVLYEIFTGNRAFAADTLAELTRERSYKTPSRPSSVIRDLDPAVERAIMRCLEPEPAARPESVLAVAAALPGGDPLAAAIAAGETPSPEMVAAAGQTSGIPPRIALACLAFAILGLIASAYLAAHNSALDKMALEQPPEVLTQRAREIASRLGYPGRPLDSALGFEYDQEFINYIEKTEKRQARWNDVLSHRPSILQFWYRESPHYMVATNFHAELLTPGLVDTSDPPPVLSGMLTVRLDPQGQLTFFEAIPPQVEAPPERTLAADWNPLFAAAGLDRNQFQPAQPTWNSLAAADERVAWAGTWPGTTRPLRIEAAAWHGKAVFFSLIGPWTRPARMRTDTTTPGQNAANVLMLILLMGALVGSALLARRHLAQGRGDASGALRLAGVLFTVVMLLWVFKAHHVPSFEDSLPFVLALSTALFFAVAAWLLYVALEPYVRRHWPHSIISWSRLLMGNFRDPLVGRDILYGVVLGVIWIFLFRFDLILAMRAGAAPEIFSTDYLLGGRFVVGALLARIPGAIVGMLLFFFVFLVLRVVLRRQWLAAVGFVTVWTLIKVLSSSYPLFELPAYLLLYALAAFVLVRFGLVAIATGAFTVDFVSSVPFSSDWSTWYVSSSLFPLLLVSGIAVWGFYGALGGRKLWTGDPF